MRACASLVLWLSLVSAPGQAPEWIWHADTNAPTVFFRKTFRIPPQTWNSRLTVSADDRAEVYLNGVLAASCSDWREPSRGEVTVRLHQGENVIAIKAQNKPRAGESCGLLVHLNVGGELNVVSDASWLSSTAEEPNWSSLNFNAAAWARVTSLGAHGIEPWGDVLFRAGATDPASIKVPDGFKVELLRSAGPAEGSWIGMTFDDKNRVVISPQGQARPLLRLTFEAGAVAKVEPIEAPIHYAMGLLHAFGSLYVNGIGPRGSGLYRLIDANANDHYETNELHFLKSFEGGGEHGYHALALGLDQKIYILNGNGTKLPVGISPSSPYRNYAEDALTGEIPDEIDGTRAPNCHVLRTDADGKSWELFAGGMRNAYDMDFNEDGELFTFDSDNEWNWGVPWYRPTQILHLIPGGESGWRDGPRMWNENDPAAMPAVASVGVGSPTGVKFARGTNFPTRYRKALFIQDWSYGRIMVVHLTENGASYAGTIEPFLKGAPLNLTALCFGADGAMYFTTGGRGTQSGLYRVAYTGPADVPSPGPPVAAHREARQRRRMLESLGGTPSDLPVIQKGLLETDPAIRFAARVQLEAMPLEDWKGYALNSGLTPLLALARVGGAENQPAVLSALRGFPMEKLSPADRLLKLRVLQISLARHGAGQPEAWKPIIDELNGSFRSATPEMKREIIRVLIHLKAPGTVAKAIGSMAESGSREEEMFYVELLRNTKDNWGITDREAYFSWFLPSTTPKPKGKPLERYFADVKRAYVDGASYDSYLARFRHQAMATLTAEEKLRLEPLLAKPIARAQLLPATVRPFVRDWKLEDILLGIEQARRPDLARGRQAFVDAQCLTCHRFGNDGGNSGPELTSAASKYRFRDLLEAIIEPSKVINAQYQDHTGILKDGERITGQLVSSTDTEVIIVTDRTLGTRRKFPPNEVDHLLPSALSPMPQGLVNHLSKEEILDLIAYLQSAQTGER